MLKGTLESRVSYRIKRSRDSVFIRKDFEDIGGYDQIGRVLRQMVKKDCLINIGYGLYARARKSSVTGNLIPEKPLQDLAIESLKKLKVKTIPTRAEQDYNRGLTTQVPTGRSVAVKVRVSRKIGYDGKFIAFEKRT